MYKSLKIFNFHNFANSKTDNHFIKHVTIYKFRRATQ